ncbi:MAG: hypothetical protein NZ824_04725 [Candidatus Thioglobus sp.]|nr:hypothetical protein [Candidatus Thioglobus sp.]
MSDKHIEKCQAEAESGDYTFEEIHGVWESMEKAEEAVEGIIQERDMLADENRRMAEYLTHLHITNRIDLYGVELGWVLNEEDK